MTSFPVFHFNCGFFLFFLQSGGTALLRAAAQGNTEAVRVLLSKGASPGLANGMGLTPLTAAAQTGNIDVVQPLAEACHAVRT